MTIDKALGFISKYWSPHSGQKRLLTPVLKEKIPLVYVECGRKFGKTEFSVWMCWVHALSKPNSEVYYLAPAVKQARELVWTNNRMQTCNTYAHDFMENMASILGGEIKINNQEMRVIFPNGSFIKVDGSDNYNLHRGLKPDFVVADEYRDFKAGWIEAVRPNMLVKKSTILFVTTPPHIYNHAYYMADECRENIDGQHYYLNLPTSTNDKIPDLENWLELEKQRLFRLDRQDEYYREYEAQFIENSQSHILPGLSKSFLKPSEEVDLLWKKDLDRFTAPTLNPKIIVDIGNTTVMGGILGFYNRYTRKLVVLDCKYTEIASKATVETLLEWVDEWSVKYDADLFPYVELLAATYEYANLLSDYTGINAGILEWDWADEELAIAAIKEMTRLNTLIISDNCEELIKQAQNYVVEGENRDLPKNCPELIDCLKGLFLSCPIDTLKSDFPEEEDPNENTMKAIYGDPEREGQRLSDLMFEMYGLSSFENLEDLWNDDF